MRIQCLNEVVPIDSTFSLGSALLGDEEMMELKRVGMTHVWYWYADGGYDGSGQLLAKHANGYYLFDLGHCSCYGPLDGPISLEKANAYSTLWDVAGSCSEYYLKEVMPLLEAATKQIGEGLLTLKRPETEAKE